MSHRLKLTRFLFFFIFFTNLISAAQSFPEQFYMEYELTQANKFIGNITIQYVSKNKDYSLNAITEGQGILRLLGNRELYSAGRINNIGFIPKIFRLKNIKKPKKNIVAIFQPSSKKIEINYKDQTSFLDLKPRNLDLAVYLYQFNFEKRNQPEYNFTVLDGKKIRDYRYTKIRDEIIEVKNKPILTELYEGKIVSKENSKHYVWISKGKYRIPLKLKLMTTFGVTIEQRMVKTSLPL
ncbi:MAG: DUF3108 domain-containing protein [Methylophilaceae bacterium]|nr:DUF3108 domain-containing protein [Methylophilaceae bacterium]